MAAPASPAGTEVAILQVALSKDDPFLLDLLAQAGSTLIGSRFRDGALILKIERVMESVRFWRAEAPGRNVKAGTELRQRRRDVVGWWRSRYRFLTDRQCGRRAARKHRTTSSQEVPTRASPRRTGSILRVLIRRDRILCALR